MRYPELEQADPYLVAELRALWKPPDLLGSKRETPEVVREVNRLGTKAVLPFLKLIVEEYRKKDKRGWNTGLYCRDESDEPAFACLASLGSAPLNPVLVKILENGDEHMELRRGAAIALAWPGNREALEPLTRRALDRQEENDLRKEILFRLPRLKLPAPGALRDLLYEPFSTIDETAAATLVLMDDPEAPSLVATGFDGGDANRYFLLEAANKLAGPFELPECDVLFDSKATAPGRLALEGWLKEHPEALETEFEKARRAYLEGPARKRELALGSLEKILSAREEDLDFASAAIFVYDAKTQGYLLEKLHRLAIGLKRRLQNVREPEDVVRELNSYLLKRHRVMPSGLAEGAYDSFLQMVLRYDVGNCLGYSSLYVALAERLGLPIHCVEAPGHAFVRWDDGKTRRNLELTDLGRELSDADYAEGRFGEKILEACVKSGVFLASRTRREMLALVFHGRSASFSHEGRPDKAREMAEAAIRLNPKYRFAYLCRGLAVFETELGALEEALRDLEKCLELCPRFHGSILVKAVLLRRAGRLEEALQALGDADKLDPESLEGIAERARILSLLGKSRDALDALGGAEARGEKARTALREVRLEVETRERQKADVEALEKPSDQRLANCFVAAKALLEPARGVRAKPAEALEILSKVKGLATSGEGRTSELLDALREGQVTVFSVPPKTVTAQFHLLRARALLLLGRRDEAKASLESAKATGVICREVLELEQ